MVEVSVLLPVYNGAPYLRQTLSSLRDQSFRDFEVLCIDDCSTDDSAAIIKRFAECDDRFFYLRTTRNLGSAARAVNHAAPSASGRRFVYSSQDDLFSSDWLAKMHARAQETGADAVVPDVVFFRASREATREITGYRGDRSAILSGRDAFVASLDWTIAGNALWPIAFLKEKGFHDFGAFSDEYTVRKFFLDCDRVAFCDGVFFYRQDNPAAITKAPSSSRLDAADTSLRLWHLIVESHFGSDVHGPFALRTLRTVIRAQALIFNTPALASETRRVAETWTALRNSAAYQASIASALKVNGSWIRSLVYRPAARSYTWFRLLARISAVLSRMKSWARRLIAVSTENRNLF